MRLQVRARNVELTAGIRDLVIGRVHASLGRFSGRIRRVLVRLSDANGPRGGVDMCCDLAIDAMPGRQLIIRERQPGLSLSIIRAVERAERRLERDLALTARPWRGREPRQAM